MDWTNELEAELCGAIANVLHRHGFDDWTPEQAAELMELLQKQATGAEDEYPDYDDQGNLKPGVDH